MRKIKGKFALTNLDITTKLMWQFNNKEHYIVKTTYMYVKESLRVIMASVGLPFSPVRDQNYIS